MRAVDARRDIERAIEDIDEVRELLASERARLVDDYEFVSEKYVDNVQRATLRCYGLRNDLRDLLG